jgi:hypothetical protein
VASPLSEKASGPLLNRFRMKCTWHRCQLVPCRTEAIATLQHLVCVAGRKLHPLEPPKPPGCGERSSRTPRPPTSRRRSPKPPARRFRGHRWQRRTPCSPPSPSRIFQYSASSHTYGYAPSRGRPRKMCTRSSSSAVMGETSVRLTTRIPPGAGAGSTHPHHTKGR